MTSTAATCQLPANASAGTAITFIAYPRNVIVQYARDWSANRPEKYRRLAATISPNPAISAT